MNSSTSFLDQLRRDFHINPVNMRVILPCGSHAVIRAVSEFDGPPAYRVQKCDRRGRYLPMNGAPSWYSVDELSLFYWEASINLSQTQANSDTRNGAT
jgi:hypothetical protein